MDSLTAFMVGILVGGFAILILSIMAIPALKKFWVIQDTLALAWSIVKLPLKLIKRR